MCNHDWIECGDEKICLFCGQVVKADEPAPSVTEMILPINQVLHGNSLEVLKTRESVICGKEKEQGIDKFINQIIHGDCLEVMKEIPNNSIDMILADLPYGTTACKWDTIIPFEPLWAEYKRIIKKHGAIVLTASQPFTSALVMSNPKGFKHEWVWDKVRPSGFQVAKYKPMQRHENVLVFTSEGERVNYFPIMEPRDKPVKGRVASSSESSPLKYSDGKTRIYTHKNPQSIIIFPKPNRTVHPTQKPVALFEYLIRTYTDEDEIVLDNCAGSFTTAVACDNTNRNWICIEKEEEYCNIGLTRVNDNREQLNLPLLSSINSTIVV